MLVTDRKSNDPNVRLFVPSRSVINRVRRRLRYATIRNSFSKYISTRPEGYEQFSDDRTVHGREFLRRLPPHDVINLHWVADFVQVALLFSGISPRVPVFWKLDDMNAFTGGCHFDHDCGKHVQGCGACPQLGSNAPADLSHQIWSRKKNAYASLTPDRLHIVALNEWMANKVRQSPLLGRFSVTVIPNGLNTDTFAPRDTGAARDGLGLPREAKIVLFAADSLANRRKGFAFLLDAIRGLNGIENLVLLSAGRGKPHLESNIRHVHLGHVENDQQLSQVYSAADLFVMASLQDNQPNTVLEAMACGTPVVGFDVGGVPEMVRPGITGMLARPADAKALRTAIADLLRCAERRAAMGAACRRTVMEEYRLETQSQRYVELYQSALHGRSLSIH
jgi:glycosyltransferase involved in cell wall biosynthesis